jgi:protein phosphatase PTC1
MNFQRHPSSLHQGGYGANLTSVQLVSVADDHNPKCRNAMEDAHVFIDGFGKNPKQSYFGVYDGHGGRAIVEYLEKYLHQNFEKEILDTNAKTYKEIINAFETSFLLTDIQTAKANLAVSGSTAIVNFIQVDDATGTKHLHTANCGDARSVLSRNGVAIRLSHDHKASDIVEKNRIEKSGGFILRNRVLGVLAVSRSFGDHSLKQFVVSTPYVKSMELTEDDEFLILACDGVWDVMSDQEVVDFVKVYSDSNGGNTNEKFDLIARALVDEALKRGSTDNITAYVVKL